MGQGYSLTTLSAGSAGIDVPELTDLKYERSLGDARFMKAVRARHRDGLVVVKVVMKPYASLKFEKYIKQITHIEKRWLSFQLLSAVRDAHACNVYHGDIKTENALVTSWNWLYLSDFSSAYKPTFLPEDNPAEFSFYFDISGRRTCYLAPERFLEVGEDVSSRSGLTWAMDIFSVGCVIAEMFLETPIFNLSQLFKYRRGEYDPTNSLLRRIEDEDVRELIAHMIQVEPESRYSADEYLNFWRRRTFPEYFYSFLHQYMHLITDPTAGQAPRSMPIGNNNNGEADDRIDRVYHDYDKISYFLGYDDTCEARDAGSLLRSSKSLFPLHLDVPNRRKVASPKMVMKDEGTLLFLNIITSSLRSTARASSRVRACELLLVFSEHLTDEARLDRVLPFIVGLFQDPSDSVKIAALRSLSQLLAFVSVTSPVNAYLFPEYLIPRLETFSPPLNRKLHSAVRATYASCLASISESASRFLDIIQILKAEGALSSVDPDSEHGGVVHAYQDLYDSALADLVRFFERQTKDLLTDESVNVRRAFLGSVSSLCVFFGSAKANDVILSHLNTYLNDRDWRLKRDFFETIIGVAVYVGATNVEEFILPLMLQALTDPEESVVENVLMALSTMAQLGLLRRSRVWELVDLVARFFVHPNAWIREAATRFVCSTLTYTTTADRECIMTPLLRPFLSYPPRSLSEVELLDALKKPLSRPVLDMASTWALKAEGSLFWKKANINTLSATADENALLTRAVDLDRHAMTKLPKTGEDQHWLARLRNSGMSTDDEVKLIALRDYVCRMARRRGITDTAQGPADRFGQVLNATTLDVPIETVFFDHQEHFLKDAMEPGDGPNKEKGAPQTIADALLDASANSGDETRRASVQPSGNGTQAVIASPSYAELAAKDSSSTGSTPLSISPGAHDNGSSRSAGTMHSGGSQSQSVSRGYQGNLLRHEHAIQRKGSAIDLIQQKKTSSKASPEISMSSTNAIGENDGNYHVLQSSLSKKYRALKQQQQQQQQQEPALRRNQFQGAHNYSGRDPNVLQFLDSIYLENFPLDEVELGESVTPVQGSHLATNSPGTSVKSLWKPSSSFVAGFGEHSAPINRVVVSPDHLFFLTGSDDGSVRTWDCARLEQNLAHRSRQVHRHGLNTKITSLCFVQNTHCFVSAASDGSLQLVKIDCSETAQAGAKYGKSRILRHWRLPVATSHVVWSEHYRVDVQSVLMLATNGGEIIALDLRSMTKLYTLTNPIQHGTPTCFCLGADRHWLLLGTSLGCLDLWDLRFRVRIKSWSIGGASPVHRIYLHPLPPLKPAEAQGLGPSMQMKLVCVAGGTGRNEITLWDLETATCAGVYRTPSSSTHESVRARSYSLTDLNATSSSNLLVQLATSLPLGGTGTDPAPDHGVRAFAASAIGSGFEGSPERPFFVAAGSDLNVRYWDLTRIERSCIVSGPSAPGADNEKSTRTPQRSTFTQRDKTSLLPVFEQRVVMSSSDDHSRAAGSSTTLEIAQEASTMRSRANVGAKRSATASVNSSGANEGYSGARSEGLKERSKPTIISEQQQRLLKSHQDTILDVVVVEYPKRLIVSVDRSGVVLVFS